MSIAAGTRLGPYQVSEPIGSGGMGEVYRARDTRLDRTVAIKVLPEHLSALPDLRERFEREARAVSSLNHPNICTLFDIGSQDGIDSLVMEHLEGETLADRLAPSKDRALSLTGTSQPDVGTGGPGSGQPSSLDPGRRAGRPLALEEALAIAVQIASALDAAHRAGITHRDLKPGNIVLTKTGAKLLDFGLAKQARSVTTISEAGQSFLPTEDVGTNLGNSAAGFTVSDNGRLAYRTGASTSSSYLKWFDRSGKESLAVDAPGGYQSPAVSPDLQHIAVAKADGGSTSDIWILDLVRGTSTKFTVDPGNDLDPLWSPDGNKVVFRSNRAGRPYDLYEKSSGGVVQEDVLLKSAHTKVPLDWSTDGRLLLYLDVDPQTGNDLWVLPMTGEKKPEPVVRSQFNERWGRFSPDGRWIAYTSNDSGRSEVYVQGFPKAASRIQISTVGGGQPHWRRDGKELLFISLATEMMAVDIGMSSDAGLKAGLPRKLFPVNPLGLWDVTPDGQRFLINSAGQTAANVVTPITVVVNWDRRSPPAK